MARTTVAETRGRLPAELLEDEPELTLEADDELGATELLMLDIEDDAGATDDELDALDELGRIEELDELDGAIEDEAAEDTIELVEDEPPPVPQVVPGTNPERT